MSKSIYDNNINIPLPEINLTTFNLLVTEIINYLIQKRSKSTSFID